MFTEREQGLLPRALLWLVCLGSFFFISYGLANWFTSLRSDVGSVVFSWEHKIPLWSWTIVPYWSIDLLYGLAILLATTKKELDTLARRLLTAQIICVSCFLLFPLRFTFDRPALDSFFGLMFDILMGFDKPFNQAPSLHITLLVILWVFYAKHISKSWRWLLHSWFLLIGLSVLTTWQHHFFDIPTGMLVGCLCIWLWPEQTSSPLQARGYPKQWRWTLIYLLSSLLIATVSIYLGGWWLWLCWLATALLLVSLNYSFIGAVGFQKQANGKFSIPVWLLYAPYILIMWINSRVWTRKNNPVDLVIENIYLGRIPSQATLDQNQFNSIVDFCAELPIVSYQGNYYLIPVLDMTVPTVEICKQAALTIDQCNQQGKVLVCCALGYSRSAVAIVAWLLWSNKATTIEDAIAMVRKARPDIVISRGQQDILQQWMVTINNDK